MDLMKKALSPPDGNVKLKPYQKLRKEYLEFFDKFPWFEDLKSNVLEFFGILEKIVMTDYHTNATKALRAIYNMNKYFKNITIKFTHYDKLLNFFLEMLTHFDKTIESTFFLGEYKLDLPKRELIEKALVMEKDSHLSLSLINEFMDLIIFLDQLYKEDPGQNDFFKKLKDPLIFIVAKSYDSKWLKFSHQTKEFFTLKNCMIFLINQYLNNADSYQCECLLKSKESIIKMLILNIKSIPSTFWQIKKQFLKFFKDFLIRVSRRQEEEAKNNPGASLEDNIFIKFKLDILDPKFITQQSDNNIEIFKEFSYLIIEFSIRYLKVVNENFEQLVNLFPNLNIKKNYDKSVISAILQLLRHPVSYPVEKIECAAEYFMRLTILSIRSTNREDPAEQEALREKTIFHNELVDAISDASLERAEYLYSLSQKEELETEDEKEKEERKEKEEKEEKKEELLKASKSKPKEETKRETKEPKEESKYDINEDYDAPDMDVEFEEDYDEPCLDMDYEYMSYTNLKIKGKTKDVFEKDHPFPLTLLSKSLRKRYFLRELNGACKRIVYKVPLYFLRSSSYIYLFKKSLDVMKKLLKAFFIMQNL